MKKNLLAQMLNTATLAQNNKMNTANKADELALNDPIQPWTSDWILNNSVQEQANQFEEEHEKEDEPSGNVLIQRIMDATPNCTNAMDKTKQREYLEKEMLSGKEEIPINTSGYTRGERVSFRKFSLEYLLCSADFCEESPFWTPESLQASRHGVRGFPISHHNCTDLQLVAALTHSLPTALENTRNCLEQTTICLGQLLRYGVILDKIDWSSLSTLNVKCNLYLLLMDMDLVQHWKLAHDVRGAPSSVRCGVNALRYFFEKFYNTEKCALIEVTGFSGEYLNDQYNRMQELLHHWMRTLKKAVRARMDKNQQQKFRVVSKQLIPHEGFDQLLETTQLRLQNLSPRIIDHLSDSPDEYPLAPDDELVRDMCIRLQTSFVVNTDAQRAQVYNNARASCLLIVAFVRGTILLL